MLLFEKLCVALWFSYLHFATECHGENTQSFTEFLDSLFIMKFMFFNSIKMAIKIYFLLIVVFFWVSCGSRPENETNRTSVHFDANKLKEGIPSGLIHDGKEYRLFYQGKTDNAKTKWEQATSADLLHWNKSTALAFPDSSGVINSASFVIDWNNTSGLAKDVQSPLVAIYQVSSASQSNLQFMVYSFDLGKTWTKYAENPLSLDTGQASYKISKIIWHEESQKWILVLTGHDHVRFYSSDNLIDWQFSSTFNEVLDYISGEWDYADFYPLIDEGTNQSKWVLMVSYHSGNPSSGAGTRSIIGDFNGFTFQPVREKIKSVDYGSDNFAGVTALVNNNCYHIGCISNSADTSFSVNSFTLPRKLSLSRNFNGYVVQSLLVEEIDQLRGKKKLIAETNLNGILAINEKQTLPYELNLTFNLDKLQWLNFAEKFGAEFLTDQGDKLTVAYNHSKRVFYIDRQYKRQNDHAEIPVPSDYGPYIANQETLDFRIILDHSSVELFSGNGQVVMTKKLLPNKEFKHLKLFSTGGEITLKKASIYNLN